MFATWWQSLALRRMTAAASRTNRTRLRFESLEDRDNPASILAVGAAVGSAPDVTVYDASTSQVKFTINAYDSSFTGGVNVAIGDVNGDGTPDVITGPGPGGGPQVNVYSGVDGSLLGTFTAGDADSRSGVSVAAADFDGDGKADIVVGTMRNGEPLVQVLRFSDGTALHGYTPFAGATSVSVATGDVNDDGTPDVVVGSGPGITAQVTVFNGTNDATLLTLSPFEGQFTGGVQVAAADLNSDGHADILVAAGVTGGPRVQAFDGQTGASFLSFFAYDSTQRDGVNVAAGDSDGDGTMDVITTDGPGQDLSPAAFNPLTLAQLTAPTFPGLPVGASYDSIAPTATVTTTSGSVTKTTPIPFTATFSEPVNGFALTGLTVTNGTASDLVATDAKTYTFDVTPASDAAVGVVVAAGAVTDVAGNTNAASASATVTFDSTAPVVTANTRTTNSTTPVLTGTVDDSNATVSVAVDGQTIPATISGTTWSAAVPTDIPEGTYDIVVTATDLAGNVGTATATGGLVIDLTPPTVSITANATGPTNSSPLLFTVTFNEDVTGFSTAGLTVLNGSSPTVTPIDTKHYTVAVIPNGDTDVSVTVNAGAATDTAGNANTATSTATATFDSTPPNAPAITGLDPASDTGASSTDGVTSQSTPIIAGTAEANATVEVFADGGSGPVSLGTTTADGTGNWSLTPTSALLDGAYALTAKATDAAGNVSVASTSFALVIDTSNPSATIDSTVSGAITGAADGIGSAVATVAVSVLDTATGKFWDGAAFASDSEVFTNATLTPTSATAATWSLPIDGTASTFTVNAKATDLAGNTFTATGTTPTPV